CASLLLTAGCATYRGSLQQVDLALVQQRPGAALKALEPLAGGRDQALYLLNKGMILRMQGDYAGSVTAFEGAKQLMTYLEATSVSENAGALTLSENLRSYQGALYERLLLHVYQSLNYLQMGKPDAAQVEARQIDLLLRRLYPATDTAPHGGDAFARYFSGLVYESAGDWSDAMIAYRKAYQAYRAEGVPDSAIPPDLQLSLCRFADYLGLAQELNDYKQRFGIMSWPPVAANGSDSTGQLVFIFSNGLAPNKIPVQAVVQSPVNGHFYTISLPSMRRRVPTVSNAVVQVGGQGVSTAPVESVAADAAKALAADMPMLVADELARNVTRQIAANQADKKGEGYGILLSFAGAVVDQPDTRLWNTLPDDIQLARLRLPAGSYNVTVRLNGRGGGVVNSEILANVVINPGQITFVTLHWASF
ncbi:MAG: COG3014 family protein, partial [Gammaproteobacteria bacterium]